MSLSLLFVFEGINRGRFSSLPRSIRKRVEDMKERDQRKGEGGNPETESKSERRIRERERRKRELSK